MGIALLDNFLKPQQAPSVSTGGLDGFVDEISTNYPGVSPDIVKGLIQRESTWDPNATVHTGDKYGMARGLGQFVDETAKRYIPDWEDPSDSYRPRKNIEGIFRYLTDLKKQEGGNIDRALNRYHGGGTDILGTTSEQYVQQVRKLAGSPQVKADLDINELFSSFITKEASTEPLTEKPELEGFKPVTKVPFPEVDPSEVTPKIETAIPSSTAVEAPLLAQGTQPASLLQQPPVGRDQKPITAEVAQEVGEDVFAGTDSGTTIAGATAFEEFQPIHLTKYKEGEVRPYLGSNIIRKAYEKGTSTVEKMIGKQAIETGERVEKDQLFSLEQLLRGSDKVKDVGIDPLNTEYIGMIPILPDDIDEKLSVKYQQYPEDAQKRAIRQDKEDITSYLMEAKRRGQGEIGKILKEIGKEKLVAAEKRNPLSLRIDRLMEKVENYKNRPEGLGLVKAAIRGDINFISDVEIGDAIYSGATDNLDYLSDVKKRAAQELAENKIDANGWVIKTLQSTAEMLSPMAKSAMKGAISHGILSMYDWARQGAGDAYTQMVDEGVDKETAADIAKVSGIIYAGIEQLQVKQLTSIGGDITKKLLKESVGKFAKKLVLSKGKDFTKEVLEEGAQRFITDFSVEMGKQKAGLSDKKLAEFLNAEVGNVAEEMVAVAPSMLVLGLTGLPMGFARAKAQAKREVEAKERRSPITETEITPEGVEVLSKEAGGIGAEGVDEITKKGLEKAGIAPSPDVVTTAKPEETAPLSAEALAGAQRPTLNIPTTKKVEQLAEQSNTDIVEAVAGLNKFLPVEDKLNIETEPKQLKKDFDRQIDIMQGRVEAETKKVLTERRKEKTPSAQKRREEDVVEVEKTEEATPVVEETTLEFIPKAEPETGKDPEKIATELGIKYDGVQANGENLLQFTITDEKIEEEAKGATFYAAEGSTTKDVQAKLDETVKEFKKLPTPAEIEEIKPSPTPKIVEEKVVKTPKEEIGYPAKIIGKKFLGTKHEKPVFSKEYEALTSVEKHKALANEKKLIDKQIAKMKEENVTSGFAQLNILKNTLTKEQKKYSLARVNKARREAEQVKKFAETGNPTTKLTQQINEDLDVVFEEFEGKNLTDLNNLLKEKYSLPVLKQAVAAIKKGQKDGKPAQDIRQEVGDYLQAGTTPPQIVDLATEKTPVSAEVGFAEEAGDLFEDKLPKSSKTQLEIQKEKKVRAERGGKADITGLPAFEGGEGIVGGAEQKNLFEKQKARVAKRVKELEKKRAEAKLKAKQPPKPKKPKLVGGVAKKEAKIVHPIKPQKKEEPDVLFKKGEPVAFKESIEEVKKAVSPQLWKKIDISFATSFGLNGKRSLKKDETGAIWEENGRLKVVINPSATSDKIASTLFHEVAGHAGAANVLRSNPEIHKKITSLFKGTKKSELQEKIRRVYQSELKDLSPEAQDNIVFAEWIATNIEQHLSNQKKKGIPYQVWKAVKKFLTDLGIAKESVDDVINSMTKEMRKLSGVTANISEKPLFSKDTEVRKELPAFYSPTERAISEIKQEKGVVPQIQSMIKKGQLKKAEVEWMGIEEWLDDNPKATKTDVQDFVKANEVTVEETELRGADRGHWAVYDGEESQYFGSEQEAKNYAKEIGINVTEDTVYEARGEIDRDKPSTKYNAYTLSGAENYRELLFRMPKRKVVAGELPSDWTVEEKESQIPDMKYMVEDAQGGIRGWGATKEDAVQSATRERTRILQKTAGTGDVYTSSHWDEPNVFAHARVNDRVTPEGEKVLFIEEIQSDQSREIREKGLKNRITPKKQKRLDELKAEHEKVYAKRKKLDDVTSEEYENITKELDRIVDEDEEITGKHRGVPDFPFRKNWQEFTLKNLLKRAVSEGYDRLSWVTGEQTADRYDLSKKIDQVIYTNEGELIAYTSERNAGVYTTQINDIVSEDKIADHIGKEPAKRLLEAKPNEAGTRQLKGEGLKIGGEWANNLYNKQIPNFLKKYAKKWGAKVEETTIETPYLAFEIIKEEYHPEPWIVRSVPEGEVVSRHKKYADASEAHQKMPKTKDITQMSLPITPAMKESIVDEGQPMFSKELDLQNFSKKVRETGDIIPESLKDNLLRKLQDRHVRVKTIQETIQPDIPDELNTYLNIDVMSGKQENQIKRFHKEEIVPFEKDLAGFKGDLKKAEEWAYAQHSDERNITVKKRRYSTSGEALGKLESDVLDKTDKLIEHADELSGKKADLQARLKTEVRSSAQEDRLNERIAVIDNSINGINGQVDKMNAQLKKMGVTVEKFKRVTESGSGMSKKEATDIFDAAVAEGKTKEYKILADRIVDINQETSDIELATGLISQETYDDRKKWKHYVPLMGIDEKDPVRARGSQGFDIRGKESQAALGRESKASNILAHSIMKRNQAIVRGETNKVGQVFKRFVDANHNPDMWEVNEVVTKPFLNKKTGEVEMRQVREFELTQAEKDRIISVKVDGKPYEITIKDPMLARAMKDLGTAKLGKGLQIMAAVNRYLSVIHTMYNPQFTATNFLRDFQAMGINVSADESFALAKKIGKGTPKAILNILKAETGKTGTEYIKFYNEYKEVGGKIGFMGIENVDQIQNNLLNEISLMKPGAKSQTIKAFKAVGKYIEVLNSSVENGVRLSTYIEMRKMGVSKLKAATTAKNVTVNFNKRGEWGAPLNSLYLFANANIQGNWRMITAIMGDPKKKTGKNRGKKIAGGIILNGIALAELARFMGGKDDDDIDYYDKIPPWIKERHFVFIRPGLKTLDKEGFLNSIHYVKIPMPYGYNIFHAMGVAMDDVFHDPSKENILNNAGFVTSTLWNAFNPLGSAGSFLQTIAPTVLFRQAADLGLNRDYKDAPIAVEQHFGVKKSKAHTSKRKTSEQSKVVAKALNEVMGGTEYEPSWADVSPDVLDYFGEQITGGAGKTVGQIGNLGFEFGKAIVKKKKPEIALQEVPFISRVLGEIPEYGDMGKFYDNMDKLKVVRKQFNTYKAAKDKRKDAYYDKNKELLKLTEKRNFTIVNKNGKIVVVKSTRVGQWEKKLKKLREERDAAEKAGDTERFEKKKRKIHKLIKEHNKKINESK